MKIHYDRQIIQWYTEHEDISPDGSSVQDRLVNSISVPEWSHAKLTEGTKSESRLVREIEKGSLNDTLGELKMLLFP